VPTEIVFDQALGDIFVVRVAGNVLDPATQASLQYAVNHLHVKLLVVLGHELCGAVKAAMLPSTELQQFPPELESTLRVIKEGLGDSATFLSDSRARDREAVTVNVRQQVERLKQDAVVMAKVKSGDLMVTGAFYEISTGIVDFFQEVTA